MIIRNNKIIVDVEKNHFKYFIFETYDLIMTKIEKVKKFFAFLILFFCVFGFSQMASASIIADQTQTVVTNSLPGSFIAQTFIPSKNNIIQIYVRTNTVGKIWLCRGSNISDANVAINYDCTGNTLIASTSVWSLSGQGRLFTFSRAYFIISGAPYYYGVDWRAGGSANGTASGDYYTAGRAYSSSGSNASWDTQFTTYYTDNFQNISIIQPVSGDQYIYGGAVPFTGSIWGANSFDISVGAPNSSPGIFVTGANINSYQYDYSSSYYLPVGSYWVWYTITTGASTTVSTSTLFVVPAEINSTSTQQMSVWDRFFSSDNTGSSTLSWDTIKTKVCNTDEQSADWTSPGKLLSCTFKTAMYWVFVPSQSATDNIQNTGSGLKSAFPFNVYFNLTDTVTNTIASTTLSNNGSIGVPMIDKTKHIYIAPFISSSTLPNAIGQSNATLVRNTITWLIWLFLAVILFFEFKNIK